MDTSTTKLENEMTKLVIKGAQYFLSDPAGDAILIPHYTGEFWIVDCDEYLTEQEIKE